MTCDMSIGLLNLNWITHKPMRGLWDGQDVTETKYGSEAGEAGECPPVEAEEGEEERQERPEVDNQAGDTVGSGA